jgi:non-canonical (house-cleaning) NTP pyrophosphatase
VLTVFIGSVRPAKVDGAREAFTTVARIDDRFSTPRFIPHDLTAIAPTMPMSAEQIVAGARTRARVLSQLPQFSTGRDLAIGLEGGLDPLDGDDRRRWMLQSWAAITDGGRWGIGAGPALMLPDDLALRVVAGEELGAVVDERAEAPVRGTRGAWGLLTHDVIGRQDAFRLAVVAALAPFFNPAMWP